MASQDCGECKKAVRTDNANHLQCSLCHRAFHFLCTTLSKPVCKEISKNNSQVMFFCSVCKTAATSLVASLADLTSKYDDLEMRFEALEEKFKHNDQPAQVVSTTANHCTNTEILTDSSDSPLPACNDPMQTIEAAVMEIHEQKRRECNLMVFGLGEAKSEEDDKSAVKEVLEAVGVDLDSLVSFQRLGRTQPAPTERPRALKLRMVSLEAKRAALGKAKSLSQKDKFSCVFLKPDLSPLQLQNRRSLLVALKAANANNKCMMIRGGRLVPINKS